MPERILFLTGKLAEHHLRKVLADMQPCDFVPEVHQIGISVAGLMTADMIARRMPPPEGVDRILVPGRCRGDLQALCERYGIPVERGPDELKDLPRFFGQGAVRPALDDYDVQIFAEIVDAPQLGIEALLARAAEYAAAGADVIDIGCLPDTAFPHLEEVVGALLAEGYRVSVDSVDVDELLRGGNAGAHYLLSLHEDTLWIADEVACTPVLIPQEHGSLESLLRAMDALDARGRSYLADPILDPVLFGFTESLLRYRELRKRRPDAEILMGVGNVTELTDADTAGINTLLIGVATELGIRNLLTTQVSPHARRAVREVDVARRMMFAARTAHGLPRGLTEDLMALHERHPFPYSAEEIAETAAGIRDPSYRVEVSAAGIHVYNRAGLHTATDPFELFAHLALEGDAGHAFYLGTELARAQIAWQLGKRHVQDQALDWGCAVQRPEQDKQDYAVPGATLAARHGRGASS